MNVIFVTQLPISVKQNMCDYYYMAKFAGSLFISSFWYAYARGSLHHGADDRAHGHRALPYVHGHARESLPYVYAHANVRAGARGRVYAYARGCVSYRHGRGHARGHGCAGVHVNACAHAFLS